MVRCFNGCALWLFVFFYQFVKGLTEKYPELYDGDGYSSKHQANFGKKWGNYATIQQLAGEDLMKIDLVVEEPLEKCLLFLAYQSDKVYLENLIHNEAMAKMNHP